MTNLPSQLSPVDTTELLSSLSRLRDEPAGRFDPVRFRFIEAMAQKAEGQREAVARLLEEKSSQELATYLSDFRRSAVRESPVGDAVHGRSTKVDGAAGALASLTREIQQRRGHDEPAGAESFEDELRRREREMMRSLVDMDLESGEGGDASAAGELSVMRYFREARARRGTEQLVHQVIREKPENPGPLNAQALMIRTISRMRELSPSYANRFIDYMDTLLWLEQAGAAAPAKGKKSARKKSGAAVNGKKTQS